MKNKEEETFQSISSFTCMHTIFEDIYRIEAKEVQRKKKKQGGEHERINIVGSSLDFLTMFAFLSKALPFSYLILMFTKMFQIMELV